MIKSFLLLSKQELISFLKYLYTRNNVYLKHNGSFNILRSYMLYAFLLGTGTFLMALMANLLDFLEVPFIKPKIDNLKPPVPLEFPWYIELFVGGLIAPVLEEIAFRFPIVYKKHRLTIALLSLYVMLMFFNQTTSYHLFVDFDFNYFVNRLIRTQNFSFTIIALLALSVSIHNINPINTLIGNFWRKHTYFIYLSICITFGILHTHTSIWINPLWAIMQSLPFLTGSLFLGYIRLSYGIKYSIFLHIAWNSILLIPTIISSGL